MSSGAGEKIYGQVKWFNNKSGFGFITTVSGDKKDEDVFVHHSDLRVKEEQYRYLVAGEYVEFSVTDMDRTDNDKDHKYKAVDVTGIMSGTLMCEVRRVNRDETQPYVSRGSGREGSRRPELDTTDEGVKKEWMVVRRKTRA